MPATSWRAVGGKRLAFGGGALRGGGVSTPRRLPGGPGVLLPWSPAWPSRHRMTSIHALGFLSMFARVIARHSEGARLARIRECAECAQPARIMSGTGGVAPGRLALAGARRWPNGGLPAEGWKRETGRGRRVKVNGRE